MIPVIRSIVPVEESLAGSVNLEAITGVVTIVYFGAFKANTGMPPGAATIPTPSKNNDVASFKWLVGNADGALLDAMIAEGR